MIVVDASVAVKWFVNEEYSDKALKLLNNGNVLHAPDTLKVEVASALRKYFIRGYIGEGHLRESLKILSEIDITYHETSWDILEYALELSIKNRITIYDAIYVSLSEMLNFGFITADERLHNALKDKANIRLIRSLSCD